MDPRWPVTVQSCLAGRVSTASSGLGMSSAIGSVDFHSPQRRTVPWAAHGLLLCLVGVAWPWSSFPDRAYAEQASPARAAFQQAWPALKALELEKLAVLQSLNRSAEQCIRQVNNLEGWQACRREEHQAHQSLSARMRAKHEAIRQRYGLPQHQPHPGNPGYDAGQEPSAR